MSPNNDATSARTSDDIDPNAVTGFSRFSLLTSKAIKSQYSCNMEYVPRYGVLRVYVTSLLHGSMLRSMLLVFADMYAVKGL